MNGGGGGAPSVSVLVRWASALPVRLAMMKSKLGKEFTGSEAVKAIATKPDPNYVIVVQNIPGGVMRVGEDTLKTAVQESSVLRRKGRGPINAESVAVAPGEQTVSLLIRFPKSDEISLDDKEVEFYTKLGRMEIRHRFRLKDMVYEGKLAV